MWTKKSSDCMWHLAYHFKVETPRQWLYYVSKIPCPYNSKVYFVKEIFNSNGCLLKTMLLLLLFASRTVPTVFALKKQVLSKNFSDMLTVRTAYLLSHTFFA